MTIKMIAVDMDGTFLNQQSTYDHARFLKVYEKLKERKIHFVVASGNPYKQLQGNFEEIKDELAYVSENGAYILNQGKELLLESVDSVNTKKIIMRMKELPDVLCWVCTKNQSYTLNSLSEEMFQRFLPYFPGCIRVEDFLEIDEPILKFALFLPEKNVEERMNDFMACTDDKVHVVDSGHFCVDIIPSHVNKGEGMRFIMDYFKVNQDEVMAFGDADNDIEMLKAVTYGYAMSNAKELFKSRFNYLAPSNDENGVLQVIENYLENGTFMNLKDL